MEKAGTMTLAGNGCRHVSASQGTESGLEDKASSVRRQTNRMLLCIELPPGTFHLLASPQRKGVEF